MNNDMSDAFIKKAIDKTNRNELKWSIFNNEEPKLKPTSIDSENIFNSTPKQAINTFLQQNIYEDLSFFSEFLDGYLILLCYSPTKISFNAEKEIALYIQNEESPIRKEIASTETNDIKIASQIKRLYNLVLDHSSSLNSFIDDFLNS